MNGNGPPPPDTIRAVIFVDGQNLYHCVRETFGYSFPNYDVLRLAQHVCTARGWMLSEVRFYTGFPDAQDDAMWNGFWSRKLLAIKRQGVYVYSRPLRYRNRVGCSSFHRRELAALIHAQMQAHYWEKAEGYEVKVSHGFTPLKPSAYTAGAADSIQDYRTEPRDKTKIGQVLFGGFTKCLYRVQKFGSDTERRFAAIVERDALRWFKPAKGQFQIFYRLGSGLQQYVPDFVVETDDELLMVETKARNELTTPEVEASGGRPRSGVNTRQRMRLAAAASLGATLSSLMTPSSKTSRYRG